jgi:hypothetical protein
MEDPCDDSVVLRVYLQWRDNLEEVTFPESGKPFGHIHRLPAGMWQLDFSLNRGQKRQQLRVVVDPDAVRPDRLPLKKLAKGVWDVSLSINIEGEFNGFVTLLGVPEPPPWINE